MKESDMASQTNSLDINYCQILVIIDSAHNIYFEHKNIVFQQETHGPHHSPTVLVSFFEIFSNMKLFLKKL